MTELNNPIILLQVYQSALFAILSFSIYFFHGDYSKKYLGWIMVASTLFALTKTSDFPGYIPLSGYLFPPGVSLLLSFFPLCYLYVNSLILPGHRFRIRELIHLTPALFLLFLLLTGFSHVFGFDKYVKYRDVIDLLELLVILVFGVSAILQKEIYPYRETVGGEPYAGDNVKMGQASSTNTTIEACAEEDCCRVKKYEGSGLTQSQKKLLGIKLGQLMKEKLYLLEKLTIDDVAEKLETNSKYLSQVINESHQQNFYTYINAFRIREAQRLLDDRQHKKYSIQGIAKMAGFSSKSSFNEAFRRITGMTPSEYLEKQADKRTGGQADRRTG